MSVIAAALKHMLAAGLPHDQIVQAVADMEAASGGADPVAERRRAYDRERKRAARSTGFPPESTGIPQCPPDSADNLAPTRVVNTNFLTEVVITPEGTNVPSAPKGAKAKRSRGASRRCPEDWSPGPAEIEMAEGLGFVPGEIERELAKFRDFEFRTPRSDWPAAFRNWFRTAADRKPTLRIAHERPHRDPKQTAYAERLGDVGAAMAEAVQLGRL